MVALALSRRLRRTPFSCGVEAAGVTAYSVYNRMLLPAAFAGMVEDYRHLKSAVQVWDVAAERQVEIRGRDALRLVQMLTPRDLSNLSPERCLYAPVVDQEGGMLNDPVILQAGDDTYWMSIADSDLLLWVKGIGAALGLEAEVREPEVAPLAIQGPKAATLLARLFGEEIATLRLFRCGRVTFEGASMLVARSGYSKQGGFEVYVEDPALGMPLWEAMMAAGEDLDVRAGCPNLIERIEAGLLSYGNDMTSDDNPLECGLGPYVSDSQLAFCFGGRRLREMREAGGPDRMLRPVEIAGELPPCDRVWPLHDGARRVGQVTSAAMSPDFGTGVAIAMVARSHWEPGTRLTAETQDGPREATVREKFWI